MNCQTLEWGSTALVFVLLLLQALILSEEADSFAVIVRGASNVSASDPLPGFVWWYAGVAFLFVVAAIVYVVTPARIRRWFVVLAVLSFVYGIHAYQLSSSLLLSWSGIFRGDIVALETGS